MAKLTSEKLSLEISNIVSYLMDKEHERPTYEQFDIEINVDVNEAVHGVNGQYELCDGNIQGLIATVDTILIGEQYSSIEFTEPDFSFEVKRESFNDLISKERLDFYELICWVNSGQWNGIYGGSEIGLKFSVKREQLEKFNDDLQEEWDKRIVCNYKDRDKHSK